MSRGELSSETLAGCGGSVLRLWQRPSFQEGTSVAQHAGVGCVAWNRNNKVVATGCQDGLVQLCYTSGKLMGVLRADGAGGPPAVGALRSLDWSTGSKFLAAGSEDGNTYVWDLKAKTCVVVGRREGPVTSVRYHPEDKCLAVASAGASGTVALYDLQGAELASLSSPDSSAKYSLQAAAAEPALACGSERGGVVVWDWATRQAKEHYAGQHRGPVHAVSFIPLKPSMLYSAGADGILILQDRRAGPSLSSRVEVGLPLSALSVREDYTNLAVGTQDGRVLLYDPRHMASPLHTLECSPGQPVSGLHWQHCYSSLSRSRGTAAKAKVSADAGVPATAAAVAAAEPKVHGHHSGGASAIPPPAVTAAAAAGSRIPQALPQQPAAGDPTFSTKRRQSGIGTGGPLAAPRLGARQPSPELPATAQASPGHTAGVHNPLFDTGSTGAAQGSQPQGGGAAQHTPVGPGHAIGTGADLAITPLSGMVARRAPAAPTPGHVTPMQPRQLQPAAQQQQQEQQQAPRGQAASAAATPMAAHAEATPVAQLRGVAAGQAPERTPAGAANFPITPLSTMALRPTAAPGNANLTEAAAPPEAAVPAAPTLPQQAQQAAGLSITPLSTMRPGAQPQGSVLQESTNQQRAALQRQLASLREQGQHFLHRPPAQLPPQAGHRRLPAGGAAPGPLGPVGGQQQQQGRAGMPLQPALPPQQQQQQQQQSSAFAENLPSPTGSLGSVGARKAGLDNHYQQQQQQQQSPAGEAEPAQGQQQARQQSGTEEGPVLVEDSAANPSFGAKLAHKEALAAEHEAGADGRPGEDGGEQWLVKAAMPGSEDMGGGSGGDVAMQDAALGSPLQSQLSSSSLSSPPGSPPSPGFSFRSQWQYGSGGGRESSGGAGSQQQQGTPDAKLGRGAGASGSGQRQQSPPPIRPLLHHQQGQQHQAQQQQQAGAAPAPLQSPPPRVASSPAGMQHGLREDILALHLDILNQFQVQQEQVAALVAGVVERQDALAGELCALRRQLQGLLQARDEFLWL